MSVILVAEQDAGYAERIAETLRASGWPSQVVASHEEALQAAAQARPQLLLASATLANANTLLSTFSRARGGPGAIVLVPDAVASQVSAADYQADELLAKPFSESELKRLVGQALDLSQQSATPAPPEPSRQLTSADIFGDLLAEVEEEAARLSSKPPAAPTPPAGTHVAPNPPKAPTPSPTPAPPQAPAPQAATPQASRPQPEAPRVATPPPRRRRSDDIDRKLEETLSGVMPDRLRRASTPETPKPARSRLRNELPSDDEIDDLLDRTLSSLELPTRPKRTARPAASPTSAASAAGQPSAAAAQPAAPATAAPETAAPSPAASSPAAATPATPTPQAPSGPAEPPSPFESSPPAPPFEALETFEPTPSSPGSPSPAEPLPFEPPQAPSPRPADAASAIPSLEPPSLEPLSPSASASGTMPSDLPLEPPASQPALPEVDFGLEFSPPADDSSAADARPASPPTGTWPGLESSVDLFPSNFGGEEGGSTPSFGPSPPAPPMSEAPDFDAPDFDGPTVDEQAPDTPSTGFEDSFAAVFEEPGSASSTTSTQTEAEPTSDTGSFLDPPSFDPLPPVGTEAAPATPAPDTGSSGSFIPEEPAPTSFADAFAPSAPSSSPAGDHRSFLDSQAFERPADADPAKAEAATAEAPKVEAPKVEDGGPEAALRGVLELRGEDLATRRIQTVDVEPEDGERFGDYALLERVAVGGMAEVWRARRRGVEGFQKTVAIKRILSHLTDSSDFIDMFIDEAKLAAQLSHANIIQIYDLGKVDGDFFIAMEYVEGHDLRSLFKAADQVGKPMPLGLGLMVVAALARALDYAHRKRDFDDRALGLVHRDVSPQNVLISYEGEIKLCDFGIVKAVAKASTTQMGALKGKLQYMSPEQAWGKAVDARSDIFSLGSVLFEVLTGEKLFTGDSEISVLDAVRECRVRSPRSVLPEIPESVDRIVLKALTKSPGQRYQTAGEMENDLQAVLRQLDPTPSQKDLADYLSSLDNPPEEFHSYAPKDDDAKGTGLGSSASAPATPAATPKKAGKRGLVAAAALFLLLVLAAIAVWFFTRGSSTDPPPAEARPTPVAPAPATQAPAADPGAGVEATPDTTEQETAARDTADPGAADEGTADPGAADQGASAPDGASDSEPGTAANEAGTETETPAGGATADTATPAGEGDSSVLPEGLDIEALVEQEMAAREEQLRTEYESQRRALEEAIQEAQSEATEPPADESGGGGGDGDSSDGGSGNR